MSEQITFSESFNKMSIIFVGPSDSSLYLNRYLKTFGVLYKIR